MSGADRNIKKHYIIIRRAFLTQNCEGTLDVVLPMTFDRPVDSKISPTSPLPSSVMPTFTSLNAYYAADLSTFLVADARAVLGEVAANSSFAIDQDQRDAWVSQIELLQENLVSIQGTIFPGIQRSSDWNSSRCSLHFRPRDISDRIQGR